MRLVLLGVVFCAAGALAWMLFLPVVFASQLRARTGFDVKVTSLSCNAFSGRLIARGLVLGNPPSFPVGDFVELREFSAQGDLWALWSDRLALDELTLDVRKVTLVRRPDGRSNAEVFQQNLVGGRVVTSPMAGTPTRSGLGDLKPPAPARKFLIRRFVLRFDRLAMVDYSGASPVTQEFTLGLDQRYENVTETSQLLVPEVLRKLVAANLSPAVAGLVPGDLGQALGSASREAAMRGGELLKAAEEKATDLFKGLRERLEENRKP